MMPFQIMNHWPFLVTAHRIRVYNGYVCPSQKLYVVSSDLFWMNCRSRRFSRVHPPFGSSNTLVDRLTFNTPRRPYERERLDQELRICGEYGLRCKREIWRVQLVLAKIRKVGFVGWLVM